MDSNILKSHKCGMWPVVAFLILTGCNSGGAGSSAGTNTDGGTPVATTVTGIASKGPVAGGTVTAYSIISGVRGTTLATAQTDASGAYSLDLGAYSGPLLLELTGGSYVDEATGVTTPLTVTLRSALPQASGKVSVSITGLSEAMVINAIAAGGMTPGNIDLATKKLTTQLGFNVATTRPADTTKPADPSALPAEKVYGTYLGTMSQYMSDNPAKSLGVVIGDFATAANGTNGLWGMGPAGGYPITDAANGFANNPKNILGLPTVAPLIVPDPVPDAPAMAKTWAQTWNGVWSCPATGQRQVWIPAQTTSTGSYIAGYYTWITYYLGLQGNMWCVEQGGSLPIMATMATVTNVALGQTKGEPYCPADYYQPANAKGWCVYLYPTTPFHATFLATYTPPPSAPASIATSTGSLTCPTTVLDPWNPKMFPVYLQGSWCLPTGADMPVLAKNNQCPLGLDFKDGWCLFSNRLGNGKIYGPVKPVDPTIPLPKDAADPELYDYVSFTYTCPADTYHPDPYTTTGSAFGAPKPPLTATGPCLSQSKALEQSTCGSGASGFSLQPNINYARAEANYNTCLANNSTEPFKTRYLDAALAANDRLDFFLNACPYPQVKRDGVCVDQPPPPVTAPAGATTGATACLTDYTGPDSDPQVDSFCKLAAFDACLHRATQQTTYDAEGRTACATLSGLLSAIGATNTYSCKYCPYPY